MWDDVSFSVASFDPDSWGPSWGLTWEAAQDEEVKNVGGGEQGRGSRKRRSQKEEIDEEEHLESLKQHGARIYAKPPVKVADEPKQETAEAKLVEAVAKKSDTRNREVELLVARQLVNKVSAAKDSAVEVMTRISAEAVRQAKAKKQAKEHAEQQAAMIAAALEEFF